jgi:predicted RND superfamily exporter protein
MKKFIINYSTRHPKKTIVCTVILTLFLGSGLFKYRGTSQYTADVFRNNSLAAIAKKLVLFPIELIFKNRITINTEIFKVRIDDNIINMLPKNLASYKTWRRLEETFGSTEFTLLAFGNTGKTILAPEPFTKIREVTEYLEDISGVDRVRSLATLNKIEPAEGGMHVSSLIPEDEPVTREIVESAAHYLRKHQDIASNFISKNHDFTAFIIIYESGADEGVAAAHVEGCRNRLLADYQVFISGTPFLRGIIMKNIRGDLVKLIPIVILVLFFVLAVMLRMPRAIPLVFQVIVLSVLPTIGLMGWFNQKFAIINATMHVILLTIACADSIHIISRFAQKFRKSGHAAQAVRDTMQELMLPVFLTSITTMAAFLTLLSSPITAMVPYGIFISFGVGWAWLLSVTFLPARLFLMKHKVRSSGTQPHTIHDRLTQRLADLVCRRSKAVLITGILIILVSLGGLFRIIVEVNFNHFFPKSNPIRIANTFVDSNLNGTMNISLEVKGEIKDPAVLNTITSLCNKLEGIEGMGRTMSIATMIAKMNRAIYDDDPAMEKIPETRAQVAQLLELYAMSGDPSDLENIVDYEYKTALVNATMKALSTNKITRVVKEVDKFTKSEVDTNRVRIQSTGFSMFIRDFVGLVIKSSLSSIIFSIFLVFIISLVFFSSFKWAGISILPLCSAVLLNFGLMGYLGIELSHVTALMTSIIIGVGIDFAMHFISEARLHNKDKISRELIAQKTINGVGRPILINAVSVAVGFSVMLFSNFVPMRFLGMLVSLSMLSCAFGALTIMASVVHLTRIRLFSKD